MLKEHYLLYLDILGFSKMAETPDRVFDLYEIISKLNVHKHSEFHPLIFSDTLLVYNRPPIKSQDDKNYVVMYLCEFAQDLLYRTIGRDYYFRAFITAGPFYHSKKDDFDVFFGPALIAAYNTEKNLNGCGLFIDEKVDESNIIFPTRSYSNDIRYVYLLQKLARLDRDSNSVYPVSKWLLDGTDIEFDAFTEIKWLQDIYNNMSSSEDPRVRAKYLETWNLFALQYPVLTSTLVGASFNPESICQFDWKPAQLSFERDLKSNFYKHRENVS